MRYCPNCQRLSVYGEVVCGSCGDVMRPPMPNDPVLLIASDALHALMVEPLLAESGLPYSKVGDLGIGFTMNAGTMLETYRFYVPFCAREQARGLIESALGEDPEIAEALQNN